MKELLKETGEFTESELKEIELIEKIDRIVRVEYRKK